MEGDTVVPNPMKPLSIDRFAYVFNNPLNYIDPSGNAPCLDGQMCGVMRTGIAVLVARLHRYGITTEGMTFSQRADIAIAAELTGQKFVELIGGTSESAFKAVHGRINIIVLNEPIPEHGNCETEIGSITCYQAPNIYNTIHEFGHVFDKRYQYLSTVDDNLPQNVSDDPLASDYLDFSWVGSTQGYVCHPGFSPCIQNPAPIGIEEFADMYLNWVLDVGPEFPEVGFSDDLIGNNRRAWMTTNMQVFIQRMEIK